MHEIKICQTIKIKSFKDIMSTYFYWLQCGNFKLYSRAGGNFQSLDLLVKVLSNLLKFIKDSKVASKKFLIWSIKLKTVSIIWYSDCIQQLYERFILYHEFISIILIRKWYQLWHIQIFIITWFYHNWKKSIARNSLGIRMRG